MTSRMQISLEPEMRRRIRARAGDLGISIAEYVRRLVAQDLGKPVPTADPSDVFDLGNSGGTDIASNKDELIGQAITAERLSRSKQS